MALQSDIYLAGVGMLGPKQITVETAAVLREVKVIYNFSANGDELLKFNNRVQDVAHLYEQMAGSHDVYAEIAAHLLDKASLERPVAIVFDGNPMICCGVSWKVASLGARSGLKVEALAAVSCFDVLPMELGFDPGDLGMQTLESTSMVRYGLALNPSLSTLLLQISHFGIPPGLPIPVRQPGSYTLLVRHLLRYFPPDHPAVFIRSASSEETDTLVFTTEISKIDDARNQIQSGMTLYLPRLQMPPVEESRIHQS